MVGARGAGRLCCPALSPVEYLNELFAQTDRVQPEVNALGDQYRDDALAAARQAEARYASGTQQGRLDGLPLIVKDETEIAGRRTTNGSLLWQEFVSEESDPIVERLVDAGAVIHGRGLTPEFSIPFWTHSRLWGVTRNPWNLAFDVGGSSGGSAAAVASGMTPLGHRALTSAARFACQRRAGCRRLHAPVRAHPRCPVCGVAMTGRGLGRSRAPSPTPR